MVDAYIKYSYQYKDGDYHAQEAEGSTGASTIDVMDTFRMLTTLASLSILIFVGSGPGVFSIPFILPTNRDNVASIFIQQGLVPCAPRRPRVVFTIRLLEQFHMFHLRCPHLTVQPFVKALFDLHAVCSLIILPIIHLHLSSVCSSLFAPSNFQLPMIYIC